MNDQSVQLVMKALDNFKIELPSWGFANTGTRFGKFIQAAAATTIEEKFSDAGQVHAVTGACPTLALHVQWDLPNGLPDASDVEKLATKFGIRPWLDQSQYFSESGIQVRLAGQSRSGDSPKSPESYSRLCRASRKRSVRRDVSPWFADGSNYPGHAKHAKTDRLF